MFEADLGRLGWRTWRQVVAAVRAFQPDILHSHGKGPGLYGRLLGRGLDVGVVHTFHGWHPPRRYRLVYTVLERWLSRRTDALIHVAPTEQDEALRLGLKPKQSWCILNGVDVARVRERAGGPCSNAGVFSVGTVARNDPIKRVDLLQQAVMMAGKMVLVMPESTVGGLYGLIHVYASASEGEGCPYGLLDAMACGLPVVATRVRGHTDLVRHGITGFLTGPGDVNELAYYLHWLAGNSTMRAEMGEMGRRVIQADHRLEDMVRRTADCYRAI